ncbi:MAG: serpin family protein [Methylovirgula sp.]|uniref:serpin family protein n=1 Tax=Methylovirgula sp. TaxID=1978224 RepID=UPI0030760872
MNFRRILTASPLFVALAGFYDPALSQAPASPRPKDALVSAYNATGERLFQDLAQAPGNIVLSPYSIGSALSMVLAGARGETATAIGDTLGLHLSDVDLASANSGLIAGLNAASGKDSVTLNSANALIEVKSGIVDADYRALLQKSYDAEAFTGDLDAINEWVAQKTSGKISHILSDLPDDTALVLANAAYLKAFWQNPFDKRVTKDGPFHLSALNAVQVPMMHDEDNYALVKGDGYNAIRLPYRSDNGRLGMIVVLPDTVNGVAALAAKLGPDQLAELLADLNAASTIDVRLQVPRFHADFQKSLAAPLQKAGMGLAFEMGRADFSGVTGKPTADLPIAIGDVVHHAVIDVNEESSEAAAATVVEEWAGAMAPENRPVPVPFIVDRPFLFFIVDQQTGAVLFQGRIADPRK